jgi:hypothetical protein
MFPLLWPDHETSENPQGGFSVEAGLVALEQTAPAVIKYADDPFRERKTHNAAIFWTDLI